MPETQNELEDRYLEAAKHAQHPIIEDEDDELVERFHDIESRLETLWSRDHAEWIAGFYRRAYRAYQDGDRETAPCGCPNPRCPLKQGRIPYQLRRRTTSLTTPDSTPMETLRGYLKTHPEATIIEEALEEIEALRGELLAELADFNRDARDILETRDDVDVTDVLAEAVQRPQTLTAPAGRTT